MGQIFSLRKSSSRGDQKKRPKKPSPVSITTINNIPTVTVDYIKEQDQKKFPSEHSDRLLRTKKVVNGSDSSDCVPSRDSNNNYQPSTCSSVKTLLF